MELVFLSNYLIYEDGKIWSKHYKKFLKDSNCRGYRTIKLVNDDGIRINTSVHRLVARCYVPNPENKNEVDHIDNDKSNNHASNLRWCTRLENMCNLKLEKNNSTGHLNISEEYIRGILHYNIRYKNKKRLLSTNKHTLEDAIRIRDSMRSTNNELHNN